MLPALVSDSTCSIGAIFLICRVDLMVIFSGDSMVKLRLRAIDVVRTGVREVLLEVEGVEMQPD